MREFFAPESGFFAQPSQGARVVGLLGTALTTALIAKAPLGYGLSLRAAWIDWLKLAGMYLLGGYANLLACAGVGALVTGQSDPGMYVMAAGLIGIVFCVPATGLFALLTFPLIHALRGLRGEPTFDDRDRLELIVGGHALATTTVCLAFLAISGTRWGAAQLGCMATLLLSGALLLIMAAAEGLRTRRRFLRRVQEGLEPDYDLVSGSESAGVDAPPLTRRTPTGALLVHIRHEAEGGAYRGARVRVPIARV